MVLVLANNRVESLWEKRRLGPQYLIQVCGNDGRYCCEYCHEDVREDDLSLLAIHCEPMLTSFQCTYTKARDIRVCRAPAVIVLFWVVVHSGDIHACPQTKEEMWVRTAYM